MKFNKRQIIIGGVVLLFIVLFILFMSNNNSTGISDSNYKTKTHRDYEAEIEKIQKRNNERYNQRIALVGKINKLKDEKINIENFVLQYDANNVRIPLMWQVKDPESFERDRSYVKAAYEFNFWKDAWESIQRQVKAELDACKIYDDPNGPYFHRLKELEKTLNQSMQQMKQEEIVRIKQKEERAYKSLMEDVGDRLVSYRPSLAFGKLNPITIDGQTYDQVNAENINILQTKINSFRVLYENEKNQDQIRIPNLRNRLKEVKKEITSLEQQITELNNKNK
ncbi:MAG: hypothetical protein Q8888_02045 [Vigna little leaf phytoplasma]|nr:hypothetical protein [Vigna little leaf phytoplasma]